MKNGKLNSIIIFLLILFSNAMTKNLVVYLSPGMSISWDDFIFKEYLNLNVLNNNTKTIKPSLNLQRTLNPLIKVMAKYDKIFLEGSFFIKNELIPFQGAVPHTVLLDGQGHKRYFYRIGPNSTKIPSAYPIKIRMINSSYFLQTNYKVLTGLAIAARYDHFNFSLETTTPANTHDAALDSVHFNLQENTDQFGLGLSYLLKAGSIDVMFKATYFPLQNFRVGYNQSYGTKWKNYQGTSWNAGVEIQWKYLYFGYEYSQILVDGKKFKNSIHRIRFGINWEIMRFDLQGIDLF